MSENDLQELKGKKVWESHNRWRVKDGEIVERKMLQNGLFASETCVVELKLFYSLVEPCFLR